MRSSMRALVKAKREPGIWMEELPVPGIGHNDVLIRVRKAAICGTDIHIYNWDEWAARTIPVPMAIGHEFTGEIAALGSEVRGLKVGDRVSGEGHLTCGFCRNCRAGRRHLCRNTQGVGVQRPGCFADYVAIPASNAFVLPDSIGDDVAAFLDPLGNATHAALSFDLVGEDVLITGAGPIGIMAAAVARHVGARHVVVTDINPVRLKLAGEVADVVPVDVSKEDLRSVMARLGMREGFDVGLEMSGAAQAVEQMIEHVLMGGKIAMLGIPARPFPVDWTKIVFKMLTIKGIYGREMFDTWYKMIAMLESGLDIRRIITHRFPAAEWRKGFEVMAEGKCGKVVLDW
jgi:threonine 3-dehydrogenase